jgi:hypothetical protein
MTEPTSDKTDRRGWEPPAIFELPLFGERAASGRGGDISTHLERSHPPLPAAAEGKLGFSIEMAFPLATRSDS